MSFVDTLFFAGFLGMWAGVLYWGFLSVGALGAYRAALRHRERFLREQRLQWPAASVLVPAHNEALVIEPTVRALAALDYPRDRVELLVCNDGSTDETGAILARLRTEIPNLRVLTLPPSKIRGGKSRALNAGLREARGEIVAVYDADNTPEPSSLRQLVDALLRDPRLAATVGKVRTRNRDASWLTRFVNIEFIVHQWVYQGGRYYWFGLTMLMGTNYVVWKRYLDALGGFDEKSLVDDTEMTFRLSIAGFRIAWVPFAVTWEQEPEAVSVWFRQRVRWAMGNLQICWKFLPQAALYPFPVGIELWNYLLNSVVFLPALVASNVIFLLGVTGIAHETVQGPFRLLWALAYGLYVTTLSLAIRLEEPTPRNYVLGAVSYFTYAQLFIPVSLAALYKTLRSLFRGRAEDWVKTVRTAEPSGPTMHAGAA
jgi:cellulose synthase/poly-beta-1,6-N-acetylglucosamine synthase-like glycosyltransferase